METNDPFASISTRDTPQSQPIPGRPDQVENSAGGFGWKVDDWTQLRRLLILGTAGGSYYASQKDLTQQNADALFRCIASDGLRTVQEIVTVSVDNLAPKVQPAIFALAVCAGKGDDKTRAAALAALPQVCRTGYHLFTFARYVENFRGWGRGLRNAVGAWYTSKDPSKLAVQVVKYRQREGWSHRDLLRLAHPVADNEIVNAILKYVVDRDEVTPDTLPALPEMIWASERVLQETDPAIVAKYVEQHDLPWEALPSEVLRHPVVWEALLPKMGLTALIRNVGRLTDIGLIKPMSDTTNLVVSRLTDQDNLLRSRVHPFTVLLAQTTYAAGRGVKGSLTWQPVAKVTDALDAAFYKAFGNVVPSGKNTMLAIDISGSMTWDTIAGSHIMPREGAAAMALITLATEPNTVVTVFSNGPGRSWRDHGGEGVAVVDLSPRQRLNDVVKTIQAMPAGGTDCALPMLYAQRHKLDVDTFVVYTDSETWAGRVHPSQALESYRQSSGRPARSVVVGMVSNGFTIADPQDPGMMDVVGFDASAPQVISDFSAGKI
jgi:60 kDa SS-A/Ro ribonucleoprotein